MHTSAGRRAQCSDVNSEILWRGAQPGHAGGYLVSLGAGCKIPFGGTRSAGGAIVVVFFGGELLVLHPTKKLTPQQL
jgi:hypothetical protein